ncbi:MAG: menaquinone biosynthetic enzyme MqnA/MqnD family protein [Saprospiraceae bacterium]
MEKIRISAVSYLNTKPFIYGLFRSELASQIELSLNIPAVCAEKLRAGAADLVLTPVAMIPELDQAYLASDFCIGSYGPVHTVCIFSEAPLERIEKLYLDFHSKTSAALTQILCREYWHIQPEFLPATEGFEEQIKGTTAGLIIGDRTFPQHGRFPYVYDLGEAWTNWTGLPFVFAAWISARPLSDEFKKSFNDALAVGLDRIPELIKVLPAFPGADLELYFSKHISYELDESKWTALNRFLELLAGKERFNLFKDTPHAISHEQ